MKHVKLIILGILLAGVMLAPAQQTELKRSDPLPWRQAMAGYAELTGVATSGIAALASLDLVVQSGVAHEVRTTVHPVLTPPDALERLACELAARGVARWVLQPFRATGCADKALVAAAPDGAAPDGALLARLSAHVTTIEVRTAE